MTQDEIIDMARQAGMGFNQSLAEFSTPLCDGVEIEELEAFAKLVADAATAKEREACAKTVEKIETYEKIEKACFKFAAKTIRARGEA